MNIPTYYTAFGQLAEQFAATAVDSIAELESVLIIPTWQTDQPDLPPVFIRSRVPGTALSTSAEVGHAAIQLVRTFQIVVNRMADTVIQLDVRMGELATALKASNG